MLPLWGKSDSPGQAQDGQQVFQPRQKLRQLGQQLGDCSASDWKDSNEAGEPQTASQRECPSGALHFKKEIRRQYLRVWALRAVPPRRAGKLAYDPDLSGPSSPQRAPSPPLYSFSTAIGWLNGL